MTLRKIAVVTSSRADYGLLKRLIKILDELETVQLQLFVTGMHLRSEFGDTCYEIECDNINITEKIHGLVVGDSKISTTESLALTISSFGLIFDQYSPDLLLILGDRFEIFGVATAAMIAGIPIGHIHGGERTEGAIDEAIRHSITKMSHIHFTAAEEYKNRVIQLGEDPARVFNVGGLGIDAIVDGSAVDIGELEDSLDLSLSKPFMLVTYHPVTLASLNQSGAVSSLLSSLNEFDMHNVIFTKVNADHGGQVIDQMVQEYVNARPNRCRYVASLGQARYLALLKRASCVIGNSSSGLLEAPACMTPTVNIGARQAGRIAAASVVNAEENEASIIAAIKCALSSEMVEIVLKQKSPFGYGGAASKIAEVVENFSLDQILRKRFNDLKS